MDEAHFDTLARVLSTAGSRRPVLALLAALPGLGALRADAEAERGRQRQARRKRQDHDHDLDAEKRRKKRKKKKKCTPESAAQTCAGKCGDVANTCQQVVNCGSCVCDPPCPVCQTCNGARAQCEPNAAVTGFWCGERSEPGLVCQADGSCACDATSCAPPLSCGGGGIPGACGCTPTTCVAAGATCGSIADGCGGELACGACADPQQACVNNTCQACGSTAECGSDRICVAGACRACDVSCTGTARQCGFFLQTALERGPETTLYVCPGTYRGGFTINRSVAVIGAGQDDDPAANTILDGNDAERVVTIPGGTGTVNLRSLAITRGSGGGILHSGTRLVMQDCTVADNQVNAASGVHHDSGVLEMTRCTVSHNNAAFEGGGLLLESQATLTDCLIANNTTSMSGGGIATFSSALVTLAGETVIQANTAGRGGGIFVGSGFLTIGEDCRITGNTAPELRGGGIENGEGVVTLLGADPSPIVVDNCHENCAGDVPGCAIGGFCPA